MQALQKIQQLTKFINPKNLKKLVKPQKLFAFIISFLQKYKLCFDNAHNSDSQNPSCFPNNNEKQIDYVIVYKKEQVVDDKPKGQGKEKKGDHDDSDDDDGKKKTEEKDSEKLTKDEYKSKKKARKAFLKKLEEEEDFECERLQLKTGDDESEVFILLHCKLKRLFKEAENTKLQMRINNVKK